jgi:release factor glutamine methyltransferase
MTDIRTLLQHTTRALASSGSPSPRLDAEVLLMQFLKIDRLRLCSHPEQELSEDACAGFVPWVERRRSGEPVAYITGVKEFWSLTFAVNGHVLIPRPETECLVEEVLSRYSRDAGPLRIIDIGAGSGAIGVALATELPDARVTATDISGRALAVARQNAERHAVADRMEFLEGDLFAASKGTFDVVVSNPPYIPDAVYPLLPEGIRAYEPRAALLAGPDGTDFHREIIGQGAGRLKPGGRMFLEIGEGQEGLVTALFQDEGCYEDMGIRRDYGGMERVVMARRT